MTQSSLPGAEDRKGLPSAGLYPPLPGETLGSWFGRAAATLQTTRTALATWWKIGSECLDFDPDPETLARLSRRSGVLLDALARATLKAILPELREGEVIASDLNGWNPRVCTRCIAEDRAQRLEPWLRPEWATVWCTGCGRHNWPLQELFCVACERRSYVRTADRLGLRCGGRTCATLEPFEGPWSWNSRYVHHDTLTLAFEASVQQALKGEAPSPVFSLGNDPVEFLRMVRLLRQALLMPGSKRENPFPPGIPPGQRRSMIAYWQGSSLPLRELTRLNKLLADCFARSRYVLQGQQVSERPVNEAIDHFRRLTGLTSDEPNLVLLQRLAGASQQMRGHIRARCHRSSSPFFKWMDAHLEIVDLGLGAASVPREPFVSVEQRRRVIYHRRFYKVKPADPEFPEMEPNRYFLP